MEMIWHGTAAVEYVCGGGRILFDPFTPLPGAEYSADVSLFDGFTDIFVTHGHFDHIVRLPEIAGRNPGVRIWCTETPRRTLLRKGVPEGNLRLLHYGDSFTLNGFSVTVLHGRHAVLPKATPERLGRILSSDRRSNIPFITRENRACRENGETLFFVLEADGRTVFHMGSLNLRDDVPYPSGCDTLALPYNGWDDNFPPAKEVIARLRPSGVVLYHFDNTFPPITEEPVLAPLLEEYGELVLVPERGIPAEI